MTATPTPHPAPVDAPVTPGHVQDHRTPPSGLLPRKVQAWLMAGLAFVIVLVIWMTGRSEPVPAQAPAAPPHETSPASPATVQRYSQSLDAHDATRARQGTTPATSTTLTLACIIREAD
jgi:hypothetical protein